MIKMYFSAFKKWSVKPAKNTLAALAILCGSLASTTAMAQDCTPVDLPYLEDVNSAVAPDLPECTSQEDANGDGYEWITFDADPPIPNLNTTALYYHWNDDAITAADDWFFTKGLNLTAGVTYRLRFKFKSSNTDYTEKLEVKFGMGASSAGMTSDPIFVDEEINTTTFEDPYNDAEVTFTVTETGVYYMGFHCYSDPDQAILYVDDIQVDVAPTCYPPINITTSDITTTTTTLNWEAPALSTPASYDVYVSTENVAPDAATVPTVADVIGTTTNLTNLVAETVYYVWVRSNCGSGDLSEWAAATFTSAISCYQPTNVTVSGITTSAATVTWQAPELSTPGSYDLYYSKSNVNPTASTTPSVAGILTTSSDLIGLDGASTYYVWVRSNCGVDDLSSWTPVKKFNTACTSVDLPYSLNFDDVTIPEIPNCTLVDNVNGDEQTWVTSTAWPVNDDNQSLTYSWNVNSEADDWFFTNGLNLTEGKVYVVNFSRRAGNSFSEKLEVKFGNDATPAGMTSEPIYYNDFVQGNVVEQVEFTATTTGITYVGFHAFSDPDEFYLSLDDILIEEKVIIPVTLSPLAGQRVQGNNSLTWNTFTEMNNKGFEIQRSIDGANFSAIGFVNTKALAGNSTQKIAYSFVDASAKNNAYYRLKQIDLNGASKQSNTVFIKGDKATSLNIAQVYPNPVKNELNLVVATPENNQISLVVTDLSGRLILNQKTSVATGENIIKLNTSGFAQGTYLIKAINQNGNSTLVKKFVKL